MILLSFFKGLISLSGKIFAILFLIFFFLELVQRQRFLTKGYKPLARLLSFLGFAEASAAPVFAGIFFGIIYGAGVIADSIEKEGINKKQVLLVSVFLAMCHAIFEDTGLFLALGANLFWLTFPRLIIACLITFITSKIYR